jgi:hypothetical protein
MTTSGMRLPPLAKNMLASDQAIQIAGCFET